MLAVVLSAFAALAFAAPPLGTHQKNTAPCGERPLARGAPAISPAIVGGNEVNPKFSYPWMCGLKLTTSDHPFCGASLIKNENNEYHLLTAAHCLRESDVNRLNALCGAHNLNDKAEDSRQILNFAKITHHPNYDPITDENDIAIIKLENQPEENDYIRAVCLVNDTYKAGEMSTVTGWGRLYSGGPTPAALREVSKPIVSDSHCQSAYGSYFYPLTMMCAAASEKDACQGDSGGALVVYRNNRWEEVGVVSWGWGCADPRYPGVYADVFALRSWIEANMQ